MLRLIVFIAFAALLEAQGDIIRMQSGQTGRTPCEVSVTDLLPSSVHF